MTEASYLKKEGIGLPLLVLGSGGRGGGALWSLCAGGADVGNEGASGSDGG